MIKKTFKKCTLLNLFFPEKKKKIKITQLSVNLSYPASTPP